MKKYPLYTSTVEFNTFRKYTLPYPNENNTNLIIKVKKSKTHSIYIQNKWKLHPNGINQVHTRTLCSYDSKFMKFKTSRICPVVIFGLQLFCGILYIDFENEK